MFICRSEPCPISVGCSEYVNLLFFPYLVSLSVVLIVSTKKPINAGFSGISVKWNISEASVGTEELAHMEMICAIVYQLTKDLTPEEIERSGFAPYYVDHTLALWPQAASGMPWTATVFQSKGDPVTDLNEDLAAEQKARTTYDNILRLVKDPEVRQHPASRKGPGSLRSDPLPQRTRDRTLPAVRGEPAHRPGKTGQQKLLCFQSGI